MLLILLEKLTLFIKVKVSFIVGLSVWISVLMDWPQCNFVGLTGNTRTLQCDWSCLNPCFWLETSVTVLYWMGHNSCVLARETTCNPLIHPKCGSEVVWPLASSLHNKKLSTAMNLQKHKIKSKFSHSLTCIVHQQQQKPQSFHFSCVAAGLPACLPLVLRPKYLIACNKPTI